LGRLSQLGEWHEPRDTRIGAESDRNHRAQEEEVELSPDALALLTKIGKETSLRYGSHLIATSNLIAAKRKANVVAIQDVQRAYTLFYDQVRSVKVGFPSISSYIQKLRDVIL